MTIVTSDDIIWCKENLRHERVLFPDISTQSDPAVTDFTLITQTNHTIYDYGSFAFWAAMIAGICKDKMNATLYPQSLVT